MSSIDTRSYGIPTEGLGFIAQYFILPNWVSSLNEIDFEATPNAVEVVDNLNIVSSYEPFWENGTRDSFAALYSGKLDVTSPGNYTFYLTSDDGSALYIDGELVINNDGNHASTLIPVSLDLTAGTHDIEIRYFESGGAQTLKLEWNGPDTGGDTQLLDESVVAYGTTDDSVASEDVVEDSTAGETDESNDQIESDLGLKAKFFRIDKGISDLDGVDFDAPPIAEDILTEVTYERSRDAWWADGPRNRFAAEITGQLNVETAGTYTIYLTSDDGSELYIDGEKVIDNDGLHAARLLTVTLDLSEGPHDIELRYFENRGAQTLVLEWDGPDTLGVRQAINGESLTHGVPVSDDGADHGNHGDSGSDDTDTGDGTDQGDHGDSGSDDTDTGGGTDHGDHGDSGSDDTDTGDETDHGDHGDSGSDDTDTGDGPDHGDHGDSGSDDTDTGDGTDHGDHGDSGSDDTDTGDGPDHGDHGDSGSDDTDTGDGTDHGDHGDSGSDDTDTGDGPDHGDHGDSGSDDTDTGDGTDHGDHGDSGSDDTDTSDGTDDGDIDDSGSDGTDHGDHGDSGSDDQTSKHFGLMAQYFILHQSVTSLNEIDFDAASDSVGMVSELNTQTSYDPFWENGARDMFAARYTGKLNVETSGTYTIYLTSDDGSALYLNGERVIDNDGAHAGTVVPVTLELAAGEHDIDLRYFELWGAQTLKLEWSGPDTNGITQLIDGESLSHNMSSDSGNDTDHGDHGDTGSGDDTDHGDNGDTGSGDDTDHGDHGDTGSGDDTDHGDNGDTGSGDDTDHGDHGDTGSGDDTDHGDHGDTGSGDDTDHGDHGDTGSGDDTDHGDHGDTGSGDDTDHGNHAGHGGSDTVDHGGANMPGTIPEPTSPDEVEAFVAAVMAESNAHAHGDDSGKAIEHGQLLDLVPRSEATHIAVSDGDWFDPGTWYEGRIPDAGANVLIPKNIAVTYDGESDASLFSVRVDGELSFATNTDTKLVVDTLVVDTTGRLEIGTADNPIDANVNVDIVIANNGDIDVNWDPSLLSRGVVSHGQIEIHGAEKTAFLKVADAPMTGDTSMTLQEIPEGWQVGDKLVITGTHKTGWTGTAAGHIESQDEEVTITSISGNQITFDRALEHDHDTPRDDLSAYVTNMSRNITFSSEDGDATQTHHRGHVMFMHNDDVDVRFAAFEDLGRTDKSEAAFDAGSLSSISADSNVKGRYSFHFHKTGVQDQDNPAMAVGNVVDGSPGWGFVHHSSNANFTDNAAFDVFGAAFAAESGDETGVWLRNIAIKSEGVGFGEWNIKTGDRAARQDSGHTGDGFFFAGRLVEAAENVAANTTNGFVWMHRGAYDAYAEGLDHPEIAYGSDTVPTNLTPIQGFRDNEAFGTHTGLVVIKSNPAQQQHELRTVFDGFLNWETNQGADISYTAHYTLLDFDLISTTDLTGALASKGIEIGSMSYDIVMNGLKIEGFNTGVDLEQDFFIPIANEDVGHVVIDLEAINVGENFAGFDPNKHQLLTSADLVTGRLEFTHNGDTSLAEGEDFNFDGIKTDSIGTIDRASAQDPLSLDFYKQIIHIISKDGYYKTQDGQNVILIDDFIVDRATGDIMKLTHVVTLEMTDQQLANNWMLNNYANGAKYNGLIDLSGSAPVARNDSFRTNTNEGRLVDVLNNDIDFDDDALTVDGFTDPEHGDVYLQEDGQLLYQPDINFEGTDSFTYWAADSSGQLSEAVVEIQVWDM
ncbi:PA14 domain-containing protein [Ruegeria halocynthiae]|uniref:PA14 domain-containing protein n=1 Tax=Ruegeria halocynthiae TaxID=985054 RepID=A0A1H2YDY3_9RHOB|nr:PA14 domain-containing protein [Ruegeria halocynthiae]SDX03413.1 PA14 domain-containing protein [Ruegeria halocynthiae]